MGEAEAKPQHTEKQKAVCTTLPSAKIGCTSESKINHNLFCASLGLHYFADAKIGGTSEMKAKNWSFALHFSRFALSLQCLSGKGDFSAVQRYGVRQEYCTFYIKLGNKYAIDKIMNEIKQILDNITKGIQEKKGYDIVQADMTQMEGAICRYFVICQGNSPTQVEAISDSINDVVRENTGEKPVKVVGLPQAQWVAMDYTDIIVHIFLPETRTFYNLEALWEDANLTRIPNLD